MVIVKFPLVACITSSPPFVVFLYIILVALVLLASAVSSMLTVTFPL